ncbi:MAG: hypothetical protein V4587_09510 [Acidobacteriota bacterium]
MHDTAACFRFVKSTTAACKLGSGFPSYLEPTRELLKYIKELSLSTQDFLANFPSQIPGEPTQFRSKRELLWLIRETWTSLHVYVKPAVDADTLNVPTELVRLLTQRVHLIEKCESLEFAVIHTDKLNYFQFPPGDFEQNASNLGEIVSAQAKFPPNLGIIALPHSQVQHLFMNGLLAHEIGHFVFSKLDCLDRIKASLSEGLRVAFAPPSDVGLDAKTRLQLPEVLQDWAEELFCDLFGVHLLGPSFVLASIELFDLANLWAVNGGLDEKAGKSHFKFHSTHPARLFRLWRQTALLETLGWWNQIYENGSHYIRIMDACRHLRQGSFVFEEIGTQMGSRVLDAFHRAIETIENEVATVTTNLRDGNGLAKEIQEFSKLKDIISRYLCHAVVPSTLCIDKEFRNPSAIVLLNAAHFFYLSGIEDLIKNSEHSTIDDIRKRDIWMERVENWTTKGLEDLTMSNELGV